VQCNWSCKKYSNQEKTLNLVILNLNPIRKMNLYAKRKALNQCTRDFQDKENQRTRIFILGAEIFNESANELTLIDAENKGRRIGKKLVLLCRLN
jgi:hypothetical protein